MRQRSLMMAQQQKPVYDEQTMAFIQSAQMSIAKNHGLELDRDPAEIMRENNNALHEAATAVKKSKGMIRQSLATTQKVQNAKPVQQVSVQTNVVQQPPKRNNLANDEDMHKQGYDQYMQSLMYSEPDDDTEEESSDEYDEGVELSDIASQEYETEEPEEVPPPQPPPPQPKPAPKSRKKSAQKIPVVETVAPRMPTPKVVTQPKPASVFKSMDITNFGDVRGLPSEGLLYEAPIAGQALTLMDVLMMSSIDQFNVERIITELFNRKFTGGWSDGFNAENILSCDEPYLMHWLRASSITDKPLPYIAETENGKFVCPHCNKVARTAEDYEKMPITFADLDFTIKGDLNAIVAKHAEKGYYAFTLPDGRECDVYLRRRYHDRIVMEYVEQYQNEMHREMPEPFRQVMHTAAALEIEDMEDIVQKTEYLAQMPYSMATAFFDELGACTLSTETTARVRCPFCGKETVIPYPFRLDRYISSL